MKSIPLPKLNRTSISVIAAMVVIVILAAIVFAVVSLQAQAPSNTAIVRRGDISAAVNATGKVRAKKSARLSLPLFGHRPEHRQNGRGRCEPGRRDPVAAGR